MEVLKLKNWHCLNYKKPFLLVRPAENECVFGRVRMLLEVSGGFAALQGPLLM